MRVCVCVRRVVLTTSTPRFLATAITVFRVPKSTPKDVYGVSVTRIEQESNKKKNQSALWLMGGRGIHYLPTTLILVDVRGGICLS